MRDKAVDEIGGILFPHAQQVILTAPRQSRAASPEALRELWRFLFSIDLVARVKAPIFDPGSPLYNVPAAGVLFALGLVLRTWRPLAVFVAVARFGAYSL